MEEETFGWLEFTKFIQMTILLDTHPFKEGVRMILKKNFGDEIANSFILTFEAEHISVLDSPHIFNQVKAGNLIMEVRYKNSDGTHEYICDLHSWFSPSQTEAKLLRFITDKFKAGKIRDWGEANGRISKLAATGKYETPDKIITDAMIKSAIQKEKEKGGVKN